jgi:hypothetical protein
MCATKGLGEDRRTGTVEPVASQIRTEAPKRRRGLVDIRARRWDVEARREQVHTPRVAHGLRRMRASVMRTGRRHSLRAPKYGARRPTHRRAIRTKRREPDASWRRGRANHARRCTTFAYRWSELAGLPTVARSRVRRAKGGTEVHLRAPRYGGQPSRVVE